MDTQSLLDVQKIQEAITHAAVSEAGLSPALAKDVAFHLTDWVNELKAFTLFCNSPDSFNVEQINDILIAFLTHAPNHLAAAAALYAELPVSDVFDVGAVETGGTKNA